MIKSKMDYAYYLEMDKKSLNIKIKRPRLFRDELWKFQRLLRKTEYINNCNSTFLGKFYSNYLKYKLKKFGAKLGYTIPINTFGAGLYIAHRGTIVVNSRARIGENCKINACVNIGANGGSINAPIIGNNVYIGPGAKIFGDIKIADGIKIGANSVVNKSFLEPNITIVGVPARPVKKKSN